MQKKVLAVHDISCVGRCSLTVALPVLSAAGIATAVMPTALLSTHTGGFNGYHFRDLTEDMSAITAHWRTLGLGFDAVYTGYLGSYAQLKAASELLEYYGSRGAVRFVDPVMADGGKLYTGFDESYVNGVRELCVSADIIVPNMTEACFLTNRKFTEGPYEEDFIKKLLCELTSAGPRVAFITGVYYDSKNLGAAWYDKQTDEYGYASGKKLEGVYYGTGDVFASALLAGLVRGLPMKTASDIAVEITDNAIVRTRLAGTDLRYGVDFEEELSDFSVKINKIANNT